MNVDILKRAGVDYDRGAKRFMGKTQLYEKALSKFPRDTTFARIRAAYEAGDAEQLLCDVHEFKGVCGNVSLPTLYEAAETMVTMLRGNAFSPAELRAAYALLEKEYNTVNAAILAAMEVSK